MIDLSLVSEDAMWEEIQKRNTAAILVTLKEYDDKREGVAISYCGGKFTCVGLADHVLNKLTEEIMYGEDMEGED